MSGPVSVAALWQTRDRGHVTTRHSTIADILVCGTDGTICDTLETLTVTRTKTHRYWETVSTCDRLHDTCTANSPFHAVQEWPSIVFVFSRLWKRTHFRDHGKQLKPTKQSIFWTRKAWLKYTTCNITSDICNCAVNYLDSMKINEMTNALYTTRVGKSGYPLSGYPDLSVNFMAAKNPDILMIDSI